MQESTRLSYLQAMGIDAWSLRASGAESTASAVDTATADNAITDPLKLSVSDVEAWLAEQCLLPLHASDASANSLGNPHAAVMVLSQCLVSDKLSHQPFSGKSGVLLRGMLHAIGHDLADVLIGELDTPHTHGKKLSEHIAGKPLRAILFLVDLPVDADLALLDRLRGRALAMPDSHIAVHVSYHPNYLLSNPMAKARAWQDLKALQQQIGAV